MPDETKGAVPPAVATTTSKPSNGAVILRTVAKGSYGRLASGTVEAGRRSPFVLTASDPQTFARVWKEYVNDEAPPQVDFRSESAVFLLMGVRSSGGVSVEPLSARLSNGVLTVEAKVEEPAPGAMSTTAFSAPYAIVVVSARDYHSTEWENDHRLLARVEAETRQ